MYLGIDYSSRKIAAARLDRGGRLLWIFSHKCRPQDTDAMANLNAIMDKYEKERPFGDGWKDRVMIEAPIIGRSGAAQTAINIAMVAGALARFEYELGSDVRMAAVASWKKVVCGNGHMKKEEVGRWLKENHPTLADKCMDDDEVDALCLAMYARLTDPERESE